MNDIKIKINEKEFDISYEENINSILVNGNQYEINILNFKSNNIFTLAVNNKIQDIQIKNSERNKSKILLNGFEYDVEITDELTKLLNEFIKKSGKNGNNSGGKIKAPMPGMVVKLLVEEKQEVQKGDKVIIVEAMKMENAIQTSVSGVVKKIQVTEGQAVEKGTVLIEIEENV